MKQQSFGLIHYTTDNFYRLLKKIVNVRVWGDQTFKEDVVQHVCERQVRNRRLSNNGICTNEGILKREIGFAVVDLLRKGVKPSERYDLVEFDEQLHEQFNEKQWHETTFQPDPQIGLVNVMEIHIIKKHLLNAYEQQIELVNSRAFRAGEEAINGVNAKSEFLTECFFTGNSEQKFQEIAIKHGFNSSNPCVSYQHFIRQVIRRFEAYSEIQLQFFLDNEACYVKKGVIATLLQIFEELLQQYHLAAGHFDHLAH